MKKKRKQLIVLLVALLAVVGVVVAVFLTIPEPEQGVTTYKIIDRKDTELASATVENAHDSYEVYKTGDDMMWAVDGLEGVPQLKANYYEFARNCTLLTASYRFTGISGEMLSQYGLLQPQARVTVHFEDGESISFLLGDSVEIESRRYFMVEGEDTVYAGSETQFYYFLGDRYTLANKLLSPNNGLNKSTDEADSIAFTNTAGEWFTIRRMETTAFDGYGNPYRYYQEQPMAEYADINKINERFSRIMEYNADSVFLPNPTEQQLAEYGFDEPLTTLVIGWGDEAATIHFVARPGGGYYGFKEGIPVIWNIADYMVTWLDATDDTLTTHYFAAPPIESVRAVAVAIGDESYEIAVQDGILTLGDVELDKTNSQSLYKLLCSVTSYNASNAEAASEPVASIAFLFADGGRTVLELYSAGSRTLAVYVDGEAVGYSIREAFVERLAQELENARQGERVSFVW